MNNANSRESGRSRGTAGALLVITVAGCGGPDPSGPPQLRLGRDECCACKMSIVDQRCAAGALVDGEEGVRHVVFDDMQCLLLYQRANEDVRFLGRWAQDYRRKVWIDVSQARFLTGTTVRTAMGSGIIAVDPGGDEAADTLEFGGKSVTWDGLQSWRMSDGGASDPR
ncbi:MAG: hypothetical protein FJ254_06325 [Phycisphaerae bacterium]|nr:hypothetical protein [Phycisphaerae bacterium]